MEPEKLQDIPVLDKSEIEDHDCNCRNNGLEALGCVWIAVAFAIIVWVIIWATRALHNM